MIVDLTSGLMVIYKAQRPLASQCALNYSLGFRPDSPTQSQYCKFPRSVEPHLDVCEILHLVECQLLQMLPGADKLVPDSELKSSCITLQPQGGPPGRSG